MEESVAGPAFDKRPRGYRQTEVDDYLRHAATVFGLTAAQVWRLANCVGRRVSRQDSSRFTHLPPSVLVANFGGHCQLDW
ncbi:DivIVA domain-containing protein [Phytohabitans sp. LJ34]|uniref:DivIVA domain-containing protein n=1 Tax=Phytohabitans sp. LJ34 TaxID=3452217 RepID=UPI003F8B0CCF